MSSSSSQSSSSSSSITIPKKETGNYSKTIAMILFLLVDLGLNSSLDYDSFNNTFSDTSILILVLVQIVIQIVIFLILFLAMADTFLFRVGLLGLLLNKFQIVLIFYPIYLALTIGLGANRVSTANTAISNKENVLLKLWTNNGFVALSDIQKIAAILYYILNIRATIELSDPIYYNKDAWIELIKQEKDLVSGQLVRNPTS